MTADGLRAKVFEDRTITGAWCVEKMNEDGGYEVFAIFAGPNARQNAIAYARQLFGVLRGRNHEGQVVPSVYRRDG
jgi:hypothetical protein